MRSAGRILGVVIGLALIGFGAVATHTSYHYLRAFEKAPRCAERAPGDQRECIATVAVRVVKRSTYTVDHDTGGPIFPQPPPAPPPVFPRPGLPVVPHSPVAAFTPPTAAVADDVGGAVVAATTRYNVTIRLPDGTTRELMVGKRLYEKAVPGTIGRADLWRGSVVRLDVGSETEEYPVAAVFYIVTWSIAWTGLVILLFLGASAFQHWSGPRFLWAWGIGIAAFAVLRGWPPAMFVVPAAMVALVAGSWLWSRRDRHAW